MIALVLMQKIFSLFLIVGLGFLLVKLRVLKVNDSHVLSSVSMYLVTPCTIISAFCVEPGEEVKAGLLLAFVTSLGIHLLLLAFTPLMRRVLHLDAVETVSVIYSNAGNLVIPLVTALLGQEWVIYTCAYMSVQLCFLWSHGKAVLCGERGIDLKRIYTNVNLLSIAVGAILFSTGFRFPSLVMDAVTGLGGMIGPLAMLITGMLIAGKDLRSFRKYRRLPIVVLLRLVVIPVAVLALIRILPLRQLVPNGETVLLITLLAAISPCASTITQMAVVYGKDADYAGAINVLTTLLCILTMPLMIRLYQL